MSKSTFMYNICIEYGLTQKTLDLSFSLCYFKAYKNYERSTYYNLTMPHKKFYNYSYKLETVFKDYFLKLSLELGFRLNI